MSWPTEASFRNTTNSNVNDGEDVQPKIYLKQDANFGSTRENLEKHMQNKTKKYCSCGPSIFQNKYCSSDFVVIAKKSSVKPQPFYPDPKWADFNYAGLAVPLVVQEVLRGSDALSKNIVVHFIQGSVCGVPSGMIPDGDGAYIIAVKVKKVKHASTPSKQESALAGSPSAPSFPQQRRCAKRDRSIVFTQRHVYWEKSPLNYMGR
ncbi:hypothetical protein Aperf_G00000012535 [Anoplocephala perfoliata]